MIFEGTICNKVKIKCYDLDVKICDMSCLGFITGNDKYDFCAIFIDENTNRWMIIENNERHWKCMAHFREKR